MQTYEFVVNCRQRSARRDSVISTRRISRIKAFNQPRDCNDATELAKILNDEMVVAVSVP